MRASARLAAMTTELATAHARIAELEASLSRAAARDSLAPDLLSLRAFRSQLDLDIKRAHRYSRPLTLAILDVDRFRYLNLKHGMASGDLVLGAVGRAVAHGTRAHDQGCRATGDEFAIVFPETGVEEAVAAMGRILVALESVEIDGVDGIAASVGIAPLGANEAAESLLDRAREALDRARAEGGGRISVLASGAVVESMDEELGDGAAAALASALSRARPLHGRALGVGCRPDREGGRGPGARRRGDQEDSHRGAPPRHRQGRRARRHPQQARPAGRRASG